MLNLNSRPSLRIGFFILTLFLAGNGLLYKEKVHASTHWTDMVDTAPQWLRQAKLEMDFVLNPYVFLKNDDTQDQQEKTANEQDRYYVLATSDEADKLRGHLQGTYKVSMHEAVSIVSSVFRYSDEHNVAPELVLSVIDSESGFRSNAKSAMGARGLMQVLPVWHQDKIRLGGGNNEKLWNPDFNIKIGTKILRDYITLSRGNIAEALARYNGSYGAGNGYSAKILRGKERYKAYNRDIKVTM